MVVRVYKIMPVAFAEVKRILEEPEAEKEVEGKKVWVRNEFARNGYTLRDAKSMGFNEQCSYLYINADDAFFKNYEKAIMKEGVKKSEGTEYENVKNKIEEEQNNAASGVGAVFGNL